MGKKERSAFYKGVLDKENGAECSFTALCVWDFLDLPEEKRGPYDWPNPEELKTSDITPLEYCIERKRSALGSTEFKSYVARVAVEIYEAEQLVGGYDHEDLDMAYDCEWIPHLFETWFEETGKLMPSDSGTRNWIKQQYHAQAVKTKLKNAQH